MTRLWKFFWLLVFTTIILWVYLIVRHKEQDIVSTIATIFTFSLPFWYILIKLLSIREASLQKLSSKIPSKSFSNSSKLIPSSKISSKPSKLIPSKSLPSFSKVVSPKSEPFSPKSSFWDFIDLFPA